ncbi:MAG: type II toxin-antitoxin system VapC family toxin [Promethearchaeota archaeon]
MTILIDSNIIIGYLKGEQKIIDYLTQIVNTNTPIFISTISIYEIYLGIVANLYLKNGRPHLVPEFLKDYNQLIHTCTILDFTRDSAEKGADIYAHAQGKGITIKQNDCMIAGIALSMGISRVITRDLHDFMKIQQISGLKFVTL